MILRLLNSKCPVCLQYPTYIYIYHIYIYRSYIYIYIIYIYVYVIYTHDIIYIYIWLYVYILYIYIYSILYIVVRPRPHPRAARKHQDVCRPADMCDSQPKTCGFHQKTNPIYILHSQTYDICICNYIVMYIYICICVCIYIYILILDVYCILYIYNYIYIYVHYQTFYGVMCWYILGYIYIYHSIQPVCYVELSKEGNLHLTDDGVEWHSWLQAKPYLLGFESYLSGDEGVTTHIGDY